MNEKLLLNGDWELKCNEYLLKSTVPGDVIVDFYNAGIIKDPYIAENYKEAEWISHSDYEYKKEFVMTNSQLCCDSIKLIFKGIDLFAEVFINGTSLGFTKNAFLKYEFDVKPFLKTGTNQISVKIKSTLNEMSKIDTSGYYAIFNLPRMFVRKPQCHFGWDWAPKICASGIIDDVYIEFKNKFQIRDVQIIADSRGNLKVFSLLNYDNKPLFGPEGETIEKGEEPLDDKLIYYVSKTPFGSKYDRFEIPMMGKKNFFAKKFNNFKLWWPTGYGKANLYNIKIELSRNGKVVDCFEGRFGFRTVELIEDAKEENKIGLEFYINGKKIFIKGSNWVPPECFTGTMKDEKYHKMISLFKNMNGNMLRVWGGGSYEKDIFFDLCDEEGILVWQDFALACADIPEENKDFVDNFLDEAKYQIKRLRNHPSLIYWCGGNEKTGTYGNCITHGDFLVNSLLYGVVMDLDPTRPYRRQSPHSYADVGNNLNSGDSHYGNGELLFNENTYDGYRKAIASNVVPFVSECAILGPSSEETLSKIFPKDHIWPMDEMWADRFMKNPYSLVKTDFPHRELLMAEKFYGPVNNLSSFVQKCMIAHAETMRAEVEYTRAHSNQCGAFINWMFDDIWPSGTWSTIDYYLEPKEVYYQLKRSFEPRLVSFYEDIEGKTHLFIDNQSFNKFEGNVKIYIKKYDGSILKKIDFPYSIKPLGLFDKTIDFNFTEKDFYLCAEYEENRLVKTTLYSPEMFRFKKFGSDFEYEITKISKKEIEVKIIANTFIKSLFVHFKDNYKYIYSDNYINLEKGQKKIINIKADCPINVNELIFTPFEG